MSTYRDILESGMRMIAAGADVNLANIRRLPLSDGETYTSSPANGQWLPCRWYYGGLLAGRLWLLYEHFRRDSYCEAALLFTRRVGEVMRQRYPHVNTGYDVYHSACLGYEITGEKDLLALALEGAERLASLFDGEIGMIFFRSWDDAKLDPDDREKRDDPCRPPGPNNEVLIDTAGGLNLLWWAGHHDRRYAEIAGRFLREMMTRGIVRADGSTWQALTFSRESRRPVLLHTHQGHSYTDERHCWARGQGWALVGYCDGFEAAGERDLLDCAVRLADYYVSHLPSDSVPYYDLNAPGIEDVVPHQFPGPAGCPRDTCAAVLACCALTRLAAADDGLASRFRPVVESTLSELVTHCVSPGGVLLHGTWGMDMRTGVAQPERVMPYGNYWVVESLFKELHPESDILKLRSTEVPLPGA